MKNFLLAIVMTGFVLTSFTLINSSNSTISSQNAGVGIKFQKISFADALKLAKKQNKLIFIDAYTDWCGPCKMLSSRTFTDANVGTFFNEKFINLKIEMEKDADGPEIMRRYRVQAYPTLLFVDGNGKLTPTIMGFRNADALLAEAKKVK
jgi:thioredoxin 1